MGAHRGVVDEEIINSSHHHVQWREYCHRDVVTLAMFLLSYNTQVSTNLPPKASKGLRNEAVHMSVRRVDEQAGEPPELLKKVRSLTFLDIPVLAVEKRVSFGVHLRVAEEGERRALDILKGCFHQDLQGTIGKQCLQLSARNSKVVWDMQCRKRKTLLHAFG